MMANATSSMGTENYVSMFSPFDPLTYTPNSSLASEPLASYPMATLSATPPSPLTYDALLVGAPNLVGTPVGYQIAQGNAFNYLTAPAFGIAGEWASQLGGSAGQIVNVSSHGLRHFPTGSQLEVTVAIKQNIASLGQIAPGQVVQQTITVGGQQITYRAMGLANGTVNVGTAFPGTAVRNITLP